MPNLKVISPKNPRPSSQQVAANLSKKSSEELIRKLSREYSQFKFEPGRQDHWSPQTNTIIYSTEQSPSKLIYGVLHELAHALLGHSNYHSDFELLKLESCAWELAAQIGITYGIALDEDHIQACLDTYRDWLHSRSRCPGCGTHVLQKDSSNYRCFNCHAHWQVSNRRFARAYRKTVTA